MGLSINTNVMSLNAQRNLGQSQSALSKSMQRLSSGLRINSAKDDAAGLAISDRMTSQIRGLNQAARNSNDGISLAQTAEGALQETTNLLQRMRELAVQSANDTNSSSDRSSLQAEVNQLKQEMTRIADTTSFNGKNLLDGSMTNAQFQVGANANQTISFGIQSAQAEKLGNNALDSTNTTHGIEVATYANRAGAAGTEMGDVVANAAAATTGAVTFQSDATDNNVAAGTFTVTDVKGESQTYDAGADEEAFTTAAGLNALHGVSATASNTVDVITTAASTIDTLTIRGNNADNIVVDMTGVGIGAAGAQDMLDAITSATGYADAGFTAALNVAGTGVTLSNTTGYDFNVTTGGVDTLAITLGGNAVGVGASGTISGTVNATVSDGYALTGPDGGENQVITQNGANGVTGETLTIKDAAGTANQTYTVDANESAFSTAAGLEALDGVTATASNSIDIIGTTDGTGTLSINGNAETTITVAADVDVTDAEALLSAITSDSNYATAGFTAALNSDSSGVTLTNSTGHDFMVSTGAGMSVTVAGLDGEAATTVAANSSVSVSGQVQATLDSSYSIESSLDTDTGYFASGEANASIDVVKSGLANTEGGNNVKEQTLTIVGPDGSEPVGISDGDSANAIARLVNAQSGSTGVTAEASTTATISALSEDGTVGFTLKGTNDDAINISATVTKENLSSLAQAINDQAGNTGITATLAGNNSEITLTQSAGHDIAIGDFNHSAAGTGGTTATVNIAGNEGTATQLTDTAGADATAEATANLANSDSTVIGGNVSFSSSGSFNISSDVIDTAGSLFNKTVAGAANTSELSSINAVDITTIEGSANAIKAIDGALSQVDTMRGDLGAVQNRFESTISNLSNVSENLSAARSRILDADIAQETSAMTKNNILQQAGVSILAQANQAPQLALSLLQ